MKIFLPAVFLLVLFQSQVYGQEFNPGFIITAEKDTVEGYLLDQIDKKLVHEIKFRKSDNSEIQTLTPEKIRGFGFDYGRIFHSFKQPGDIPGEGKKKSVFAKVVESGKIDVLVWRRGKSRKPDMFLVNQSTNDTVHITSPQKEFVTQEGRHYSREDQDYLRLLSDVKGEEQKKIKYNENKIRRDIRSFNRENGDEFEISSYLERKKKEYTILMGTAADRFAGERSRYRAAVIQSRTSVEKTNSFSYISGIFYTYREKKYMEPAPSRTWDGFSDFRRQWVSIVPIGVMFQTHPGKIRPYIYGGPGLAIAKLEDHIVEDANIVGRDTSYSYGPTLALGAGARIRIGSNYIVTEVAPTIEGVFLNLGYSF